ncbi:hypothetical protein BC830DRAFT_1115013 [Chytriomyces sp. MP71]|nr:hypothetical protein BC830DRAFT_1115013 [Chytriomyces sp. MP71]
MKLVSMVTLLVTTAVFALPAPNNAEQSKSKSSTTVYMKSPTLSAPKSSVQSLLSASITTHMKAPKVIPQSKKRTTSKRKSTTAKKPITTITTTKTTRTTTTTTFIPLATGTVGQIQAYGTSTCWQAAWYKLVAAPCNASDPMQLFKAQKHPYSNDPGIQLALADGSSCVTTVEGANVDTPDVALSMYDCTSEVGNTIFVVGKANPFTIVNGFEWEGGPSGTCIIYSVSGKQFVTESCPEPSSSQQGFLYTFNFVKVDNKCKCSSS